jgi:hypothetical protein
MTVVVEAAPADNKLLGCTENTCSPGELMLYVAEVAAYIDGNAMESNTSSALPPATLTVTRYEQAPGAAVQESETTSPATWACRLVVPGA